MLAATWNRRGAPTPRRGTSPWSGAVDSPFRSGRWLPVLGAAVAVSLAAMLPVGLQAALGRAPSATTLPAPAADALPSADPGRVRPDRHLTVHRRHLARPDPPEPPARVRTFVPRSAPAVSSSIACQAATDPVTGRCARHLLRVSGRDLPARSR